MERYINKHKAFIFLVGMGASITVWAYSNFVTKEAWQSVDKRLERIEDCLILGKCKKE